MIDKGILSESELLQALRRRAPVFANEVPEAALTVRDVDLEFRTARQKRADIGIGNHVLNVFLEPRNPFEPGRVRRPKMEATVFGILFVLVAVAVLAFNLAASRP